MTMALAIDQRPEPTAKAPARRRLGRAALLLLALALPAAAYHSITQNFFFGDDFLHLYHIVNDSWLKFLLDMHGSHLLITRNAVFLLCYRLFGMDAAPYFWLVLITHLVNVWLLFRIIEALTDSGRLACFGAALWGILPAHEGTLGWYSVHGEALAATFTLWVFLGIIRTANGRPLRRWTPFLWVLALLAAATSFGVGIGVAGVMPIIAWLLLPPSRARLPITVIFALLAVGVRLLYSGVQWLATHLYGSAVASTMLLARLSEWGLWQMGIALLVYGVLAVVLGVFDPLLADPGMIGAVIVGVYAVAIAVVLVIGSPVQRRRLLACLALTAAVYTVIAAGRAMFITEARNTWTMASTLRYHYLGTAGLAAATCLMLGEIATRWPVPDALKTALLMGWATVSLVGSLAFGRPIDHFDFARWDTAWVIRQVMTATHRICRGNDVYIENRAFRSVGGMLANRPDVFPGWAAVFAFSFPDNMVAGRRIHFVESDPTALEAAGQGHRAADLLVAPDDALDVYHPRNRPSQRQPPPRRPRCR